jgi:hypothetical protein
VKPFAMRITVAVARILAFVMGNLHFEKSPSGGNALGPRSVLRQPPERSRSLTYQGIRTAG